MEGKLALGIKCTEVTESMIDIFMQNLSDGMISTRSKKSWDKIDFLPSEDHGYDLIYNVEAFTGKNGRPMSEAEIREWVGDGIKTIAHNECGKGGWNRNNHSPLSAFGNGITVAHAYCMYDRLQGRINRSAENIAELIRTDW